MKKERGFTSITADEMRTFMQEQKEKSYTIIDVRQPSEYSQGHIPGAKLIPLPELIQQTGTLAPDQPHVIYCRSGGRSRAGIMALLAQKQITGPLYNLDGGFLAWNGMAVPGIPRLAAFSNADSFKDMLLRAMDMEKGAQLLYESVQDASSNQAFCTVMGELAPFEKKHARVLYTYLKEQDAAQPDFETLYDSLAGEILEGGFTCDELVPWIDAAKQGKCLDLIELALELEINAFDLYRHIANNTQNNNMREAFLTLSQQEKDHAGKLMEHLDTLVREG